VGALLAQGVDALAAAGVGAYLHGAAAMTCPPFGMIAGDVAQRLPERHVAASGRGASA
jgi:NAD(P)H-hydrate repair Nnr-like enzyme with NAD(P)H-hydrate dehydratase domain